MLNNLHRTERMLLYVLWLFILGLFVHAGMALYFYKFFQKPSVVWERMPLETTSLTVKRGEPITFITKRCSKETYSVTVNREVVDSIAYTLPENHLTFKKGCVTETRYIADVSSKLPPGKYYMRNLISIPIRWLYFQRIDQYETRSEIFTII